MYDNIDEIQKKEYTELMERLKKENRDYKSVLSSKNYKLGSYFIDIYNIKNPIKICKYVYSKIKWKKLCNKYPTNTEKKIIHKEMDSTYFSNEEFIVYTCVFGDYDIPQAPVCMPNNCKFYIITDQKIKEDLGWEKYDIPINIKNFEKMTNAEKNRFCKMLPFIIFPNAKKSIYIDGNIKPITDFTEFINYNMPKGMIFHNHKSRTCIYDEIEACKILKKAKKEDLIELRKYYISQEFPKNYGMVECNMIVREHNNTEMQAIMNEWWNMFLNNRVKRDQLYLPYILWKNNIPINDINTLGINIAENEALRICKHK